MTANDPIVIVSAVRTPMGGFQGDLKSLGAPQLGAAAIRAAVERAELASDEVEHVSMLRARNPDRHDRQPAQRSATGYNLAILHTVGRLDLDRARGHPTYVRPSRKPIDLHRPRLDRRKDLAQSGADTH